MIEEKFDFLIRRYDVDVRYERPLISASCLTVYPGCAPVLSLRQGLSGPERLEAAAVQFGRLVLGHRFRRSLWVEARQERRDWAQALCWAARMLISDDLISRAERQQWDPWDIADEAGVTVRLAAFRMADWLSQQGQLVTFPRLTQDELDLAADAAASSFWCAMPGDDQW